MLTLPHRRALSGGAWVRDPLWRKAQAVPSLDLDFATTKSLIDRISGQNLLTYTRLLAATYVGSDGLIKTAAANEPRFTHNPTTLESLGLLVEEQRTNGIRNNTMVGAVAGTPGTLPTYWNVAGAGLTYQVVGTGTEAGIAYVDLRLSTSGAVGGVLVLESSTQVAAANGQTWTGSMYLKLAGGSLSNIAVSNRVQFRDSSGANVAPTDTTIVPGSGSLITQRVSTTATAASASVAYITNGLLVNFSAAGDITLRIGMPQLEQGAFATSVIPTSGVAATRNADVVSVGGSNFSGWYNQSEGSIYFQGRTQAITGHALVGFDDTTINERWRLGHAGSAGSGSIVVVDNGAIQANLGSTTSSFTLNTAGKAVAAIATNNFAVTINGGLVSEDLSGTVPTVTQMTIGAGNSVAQMSGTISRLTYWPQRLSNAKLQAITA